MQPCCIMQYCIKAFTQGLRNCVVQKSFAQKPCNVFCDRSYMTWAPRTRTQSHGADFSRTPGCHWTFRNSKTLSIWAQLWPPDRRIEGSGLTAWIAWVTSAYTSGASTIKIHQMHVSLTLLRLVAAKFKMAFSEFSGRWLFIWFHRWWYMIVQWP